jgi:hypothetical protein
MPESRKATLGDRMSRKYLMDCPTIRIMNEKFSFLSLPIAFCLSCMVPSPGLADDSQISSYAKQVTEVNHFFQRGSAKESLISQAIPKTFYFNNRGFPYSLTITKVSGSGRFRTIRRLRVEGNKRDAQVVEVDCRTLNSRFRSLNGRDISGPMFDDMWLPDPTGSNKYACSL